MNSDQVHAQIFSHPLEQIRRSQANVWLVQHGLAQLESRLEIRVWKEIVASNPFNYFYIDLQAEQAYEDYLG